MDETARLAALALDTRRTVQIVYERLTDRHYVILALGTRQLVEIGPGPLTEDGAEAQAAALAEQMNLDVTRVDVERRTETAA